MLEFVVRRLEQMLVDGGASVEAVRAALAERSADPCLAARTAQDLQVTGEAPLQLIVPQFADAPVRPFVQQQHAAFGRHTCMN